MLARTIITEWLHHFVILAVTEVLEKDGSGWNVTRGVILSDLDAERPHYGYHVSQYGPEKSIWADCTMVSTLGMPTETGIYYCSLYHYSEFIEDWGPVDEETIWEVRKAVRAYSLDDM